MHKALHPRDEIDRRNVSRKEGGRELACTEDNVNALIQRLEDYIEKCRGRLITTTRNNNDDMRTSRSEITRKQKWGVELKKVERRINTWILLGN